MATLIALGARFVLAAVLAMAAVAPARAQCRLCATPTTTPTQTSGSSHISLSVEATLDFDRLVLLGTGEGSATLLPNGERSASGSIAAISGRAMVGAVVVRGEPGRTVRIEIPSRIDLHALGGGAITIEDIVSDLGDLPKLDSAGNLSFRFGGRLKISGDAEGDYRGDVPITVEYL